LANECLKNSDRNTTYDILPTINVSFSKFFQMQITNKIDNILEKIYNTSENNNNTLFFHYFLKKTTLKTYTVVC